MGTVTSHWSDPAGPDTAEQVAEQLVRFALGLVAHRAGPGPGGAA